MPAPIRATDAERKPRDRRSPARLRLLHSTEKAPLRSSLFGLAPVRMHPPRHSDADQVKAQHGDSVDAHGPRIGTGGNDGRDEKNRKDGVANVLPQKLRADDAEQCEEEDEDRHLKADAQAQNDGEEEAGVLFDGDNRVEPAAKLHDKDLERTRKYEEVTE